jgi:hypothetical protein
LSDPLQHAQLIQLVQLTEGGGAAAVCHGGVLLGGHATFKAIRPGIQQAVDDLFLAFGQSVLVILPPEL